MKKSSTSTIHCSLFTVYCLLFTVYYSLLTLAYTFPTFPEPVILVCRCAGSDT